MSAIAIKDHFLNFLASIENPRLLATMLVNCVEMAQEEDSQVDFPPLLLAELEEVIRLRYDEANLLAHEVAKNETNKITAGMAKKEVVKSVEKYLQILQQEGFEIEKAYFYGSYAKGNARSDSDIDVMLVSPLFNERNIQLKGRAWSLTVLADPRIEPYMVGSKQFLEDTRSPLLDIVKKEGIEIRAFA